MLDGRHHAARRLQRLIAPLAPHLRHGQQHPPNPGPPVAILARNIRAAKVRPPIGSQKRGQRPAALPGNRRHRGLVARIHIRPLVAIHLHRDKMLVDELRRPRRPRTTRGPSRGTSGTTPPQCPAESACPQPARAQTPPRPTDAISPADAGPSADKTTPTIQADWSRSGWWRFPRACAEDKSILRRRVLSLRLLATKNPTPVAGGYNRCGHPGWIEIARNLSPLPQERQEIPGGNSK